MTRQDATRYRRKSPPSPRQGFDVKAPGCDADVLTPLMVSSARGEASTAKHLLESGADVTVLDMRMGASALHKAAQSGDPATIDLLVHYGAFIDQQSPVLGHTPLMDAVQYGNEPAVKALLAHGARTAPRNHFGETALDLARSDGFQAAADLLEYMDRMAVKSVDAGLLARAAKSGNLIVVREQIAAGVPVNARLPTTGSYDDDYTPLGLAAREGHREVVKILLEAGADILRSNGLMRGTPWHEAGYWGRADVIETLQTFHGLTDTQAAGIDIRGPYNGFTALHDAIWRGHERTARALIEAGAGLDIRSHANLTPLDLAIRNRLPDVVDLLRSREAQQGLASSTARK